MRIRFSRNYNLSVILQTQPQQNVVKMITEKLRILLKIAKVVLSSMKPGHYVNGVTKSVHLIADTLKIYLVYIFFVRG